MSTRSNQDSRIVSGKDKPNQTKPVSPSVPGRETDEKPRISLASKISSSYNRMFILCMSVGLFIMLAVTAVLDCKGLIREVKPRLDQIMSARRVEEMVDAVNQSQDQSFILLDEEYTILASSFHRSALSAIFRSTFKA